MKRRWLLLLLIVLIFPACRSRQATSRFSSNVPEATFVARGMRPTSLEVADLVANPATYQGAVQVSGRYQRLPVLVCDGRARRSPITWLLEGEEGQIGAAGYDNLLRRLLPDGFEVTVSGQWRRWHGQVGCGKEAPLQEVWFLAVDEIVAPMPLARITATPGEESVSTPVTIATPALTGNPPTSTPPPETGGTPTPDPFEATPSPTRPIAAATATQAADDTLPSPTPIMTETPDLTTTATPSPTAENGTTPAATADGTASATPETSPTATTESGNESTAIPTATATEESVEVTFTNKNTIPTMSLTDFPDLALVMDRLGENEAHRWETSVQAGDTITVSAVAMPDTDIRLEIQDESGNTLVSQNDEPAGNVEIIAGFEASSGGRLRILVHETGREATYYSLLLNKSTYISDAYYTLAGLVAYNQTQTASLPAETDQIWLFAGEAGDTVNIEVAAPTSSSADLIFHLYGPDGNPLLDDFVDDGDSGSEKLLNFVLDDDGLYAVHIGEYNFGAADYTLTVSGS